MFLQFFIACAIVKFFTYCIVSFVNSLISENSDIQIESNLMSTQHDLSVVW